MNGVTPEIDHSYAHWKCRGLKEHFIMRVGTQRDPLSTSSPSQMTPCLTRQDQMKSKR